MTEEERYTNRQIERMLDDQSEEIKEHIDLALAPLIKQVTYTNGRVMWHTKLLYMALGALPILTFLSVYMFYQVAQLERYNAGVDARIQAVISNSIQDALNNYDINP